MCSVCQRQKNAQIRIHIGFNPKYMSTTADAGVWMIHLFTALELTAVTIGFLIYCRHALDCETIEIEGKRLLVKKFIGYKESLYEFNTQWAKIEQPIENSKTFRICQSSLSVELGQFLRAEQQLALIAQLRAHLG